MRKAKIDNIQPSIVEALRKIGAFVQSLAPMGRGVSDLLVGFRGKWVVIEVKNTELHKLTRDEIDWITSIRNRVPVYVVTSPEQAVKVIMQ